MLILRETVIGSVFLVGVFGYGMLHTGTFEPRGLEGTVIQESQYDSFSGEYVLTVDTDHGKYLFGVKEGRKSLAALAETVDEGSAIVFMPYLEKIFGERRGYFGADNIGTQYTHQSVVNDQKKMISTKP